MTGTVAPRRVVGVGGSSHGLDALAVECCREVGRQLALRPEFDIASGGTRYHTVEALRSGEGNTVEWFVIQAAKQAMGESAAAQRLLTYTTNEDATRSFSEGRIVKPRGNTSEARRFSLINGIDAFITVGGHKGTGQELALADERRIPILPLPFFGGESARYWHFCQDHVRRRLGAKELTRVEGIGPGASVADACAATAILVRAFLDALPQRVFVVMPFGGEDDRLFDEIIEPAVREAGDVPLRTDRSESAGDVLEMIAAGLRSSGYVIALVDSHNRNVMYELGLAHAWGQPTLLLWRTARPFDPAFDISTRLCHRIDGANPTLARATLVQAIANLRTRLPQQS